jgi:hypothetical protein
MPIENQQLVGKFRKVLIPSRNVKSEAPHLNPYLLEIQKLESIGSLLDFEIVLLFILVYLKHRLDNYVVQENDSKYEKFRIINEKLKSKEIHNLPLHLQSLFPKKEKCITIFDYLLSKRFIKLPGELKDCMVNWAMGFYSIQLIHRVLLPLEILNLQAQGNRIVTLSYIDSFSGDLLIGNRDAFEFVLHDISHAHTFFHSYYNPKGQVSFFTFLHHHIRLLHPYESDKEFQKKLDYLLSDMNSHPEHLKSYFRAILSESKKRIRMKKKS